MNGLIFVNALTVASGRRVGQRAEIVVICRHGRPFWKFTWYQSSGQYDPSTVNSQEGQLPLVGHETKGRAESNGVLEIGGGNGVDAPGWGTCWGNGSGDKSSAGCKILVGQEVRARVIASGDFGQR